MSGYNLRKIIKVNKCSKGISEPDLIFYFSVKTNKNDDGTDNTAIITILPVKESTIYQTISCNIYSDYELNNRIGRYGTNTTIYDIKDSNNDNIINCNIFSTFYLPDGNITVMYGQKIVKTSDGFYLNEPNTTNVYKIVSGTQKYLHIKGGFVSISTNDTLTRLVMISFKYK